MKYKIVLKGGAGSGNYGHAGRPGKIGGSSEGGGKAFSLDDTRIEDITKVAFPKRYGRKMRITQRYDTNDEAQSTIRKIDRNLRRDGWKYVGIVDTHAAARRYQKDGSVLDISKQWMPRYGYTVHAQLIEE